jgi:hypothetical protein
MLRAKNLRALKLLKRLRNSFNNIGFLTTNNLKNCVKIRRQKYNTRMILETQDRSNL